MKHGWLVNEMKEVMLKYCREDSPPPSPETLKDWLEGCDVCWTTLVDCLIDNDRRKKQIEEERDRYRAALETLLHWGLGRRQEKLVRGILEGNARWIAGKE